MAVGLEEMGLQGSFEMQWLDSECISFHGAENSRQEGAAYENEKKKKALPEIMFSYFCVPIL